MTCVLVGVGTLLVCSAEDTRRCIKSISFWLSESATTGQVDFDSGFGSLFMIFLTVCLSLCAFDGDIDREI